MQYSIDLDQQQKKQVLHQSLIYLGYKNKDVSSELWDYLYQGLEDLLKNCKFRVEYEIYDVQILNEALKSLNKTSKDLETYLEGSPSFAAIACTLGMEQELFSRRLQKTNVSYGVTVDSIASAFLEYACDEFQKTLNLTNPTFRFAPGYGDIPLELNEYFARALNISKKIGVTLTPGNLFLPQKSMLGLIGINSKKSDINKKNCNNCVRYNDCDLRKEGLTCYSQN